MKYIYSERYQEAAIIDHKGIPARIAIEKLIAAIKKPCLNFLARNDKGFIGYNPTIPKNCVMEYKDNTHIDFSGFAGACLGVKNNYSDVVRKYKIRSL